MSNRLTKSSKANTPVWLPVVPVLVLLLTGLLIFLQSPENPSVISEEAHALYQWVPTPLWVGYIQSVALLLLFAGSGILIRQLVPAKSSPSVRMLAMTIGTAVPAMLLSFQLDVALGTQPLYPAWTLALWGGLILMWSRNGIMRMIAGFSGLLCGLALTLDSFSITVVIPSFIGLLITTARAPKDQGIRLIVWLIGFAAGLCPILMGLTPFVFGITGEFDSSAFADMGTLILRIFTWGSLPFIALALLAGILQRSTILLGWILPVFALEVGLGVNSGDWLSDERFFLLLPVAWMIAYGIFRLIKGIENGIRNLNAKKAKNSSSIFIWITLAAQAGWCIYLYTR
jgi:hypothetical protein